MRRVLSSVVHWPTSSSLVSSTDAVSGSVNVLSGKWADSSLLIKALSEQGACFYSNDSIGNNVEFAAFTCSSGYPTKLFSLYFYDNN